MPKIFLDHSDGRYFTRQLTDEEAADHETRGFDVVHVEDSVWETYRRDCDRDGIGRRSGNQSRTSNTSAAASAS